MTPAGDRSKRDPVRWRRAAFAAGPRRIPLPDHCASVALRLPLSLGCRSLPPRRRSLAFDPDGRSSARRRRARDDARSRRHRRRWPAAAGDPGAAGRCKALRDDALALRRRAGVRHRRRRRRVRRARRGRRGARRRRQAASRSPSTTASARELRPPRSPRCALFSPDRAARLAAAQRAAGRRRRRRCAAARARRWQTEPDAEVKRELALAQAARRPRARRDADARLAAVQRAGDERASRRPRRAARALLEKKRDGSSPSRTRRVRTAAALSLRHDRVAARVGEIVGARLHRPLAGQRAAARRARPRHHLRPDGRHQHGARRDADDRRLRDLRRAERCSALLPGAARLVRRWPRCPSAFVVAARWSASLIERTRDPLPVRPPARDAARDLGLSPGPDPDGAHASSARRTSRSPNPSWMSGGIEMLRRPRAALQPHRHHRLRRLAVLPCMWLVLNAHAARARSCAPSRRTAAWPAAWASPPARVDMLAFGLGSGIAGLGGVALSQIGNVGPELGQGYIVDSFMVVVLGGVGQLAGTVVGRARPRRRQQAARGLAGAVLAKIVVLVLHHPVHPEAPAGPVRAQGPARSTHERSRGGRRGILGDARRWSSAARRSRIARWSRVVRRAASSGAGAAPRRARRPPAAPVGLPRARCSASSCATRWSRSRWTWSGATPASSASATACSSRSAATPWACT